MEELAKKYEKSGQRGCAYCGGLGHRIGDCPKLKSEAKESSKTKKDYFGSGGCAGGVEKRGAGTVAQWALLQAEEQKRQRHTHPLP